MGKKSKPAKATHTRVSLPFKFLSLYFLSQLCTEGEHPGCLQHKQQKLPRLVLPFWPNKPRVVPESQSEGVSEKSAGEANPLMLGNLHKSQAYPSDALAWPDPKQDNKGFENCIMI